MIEIVDQMIYCIKNDKVKEFTEIVDKNRLLAVSIGKFPLLSLFYLYDSQKLIKKYRKRLIKLTEYKIINIPHDKNFMYADFRSLTKRCLRFYVDDEIISPFEILLLKGDLAEFNNYYSRNLVSDVQYEKILKIDTLLAENYNVRVGDFKPTKRKMIGRQKFLVVTSIIATIITIICSSVVGTLFVVRNITIEKEGLYVTNQSSFKVALGLDKGIEIKKDFVIDMKFWKTFDLNTTLNGNDRTITIKNVDKTLFENVNSTMENINFVIDGKVSSNLINKIVKDGMVKNCTFRYENMTANIDDNFTFIVNDNAGIIEKIKVYINGKINIVAEQERENDLYLQIITYYNRNTIKDVELTQNLTMNGKNYINTFFSGVSNCNYYGIMENIVINDSKVDVKYVDMGGVCIFNYGNIKGVNANINIINLSEDAQWTPNIAGVVLTNYMLLEDVIFDGNIFIESYSSVAGAIVGGIVAENTVAYISSEVEFGIKNCENRANIIINMKTKSNGSTQREVNVGGVTAINYYQVYKCKNVGKIKLNTTDTSNNVGGIAGVNYYVTNGIYRYYAIISDCINYSTIEVNIEDVKNLSFIAGIAGYSYGDVTKSLSIIEFGNSTINDNIFLGGLVGIVTNTNNESLARFFKENGYYTSLSNCLGVSGYIIENTKYTSDLEGVTKYYDKSGAFSSSLYW